MVDHSGIVRGNIFSVFCIHPTIATNWSIHPLPQHWLEIPLEREVAPPGWQVRCSAEGQLRTDSPVCLEFVSFPYHLKVFCYYLESARGMLRRERSLKMAKFYFKVLAALVHLFGALFLVQLFFAARQSRYDRPKSVQQHLETLPQPQEESPPKRFCVTRVGGITSEGMGSFFQHMKHTIIMANLLDAEVHLPNVPFSDHGYRMMDFGFFKSRPCPPVKSRCYINDTRLMQLLPSICSGMLRPYQLLQALNISDDCTSILHQAPQVPINAGGMNAIEDYNDCAADWYRKAITGSPLYTPPAVARGECIKIGVHIRWGDVARGENKIGPNTTFDSRSITVRDINTAYENLELRNCECQEIFVYVKGSTGFEENTFAFQSFPNFTIVDSVDDFADLLHYMDNDVMIHGLSSFTAFAAFASRDKIVITSGFDHAKHSQRFKVINRIFRPHEKVVHFCKQFWS